MTKLLSLIITTTMILSGSSLNFDPQTNQSLKSELQTNQLPYRNPRLPLDQRVADLLSRMTLEEKVAQTQTMWVTNQFKLLADAVSSIRLAFCFRTSTRMWD